MIVYPLACGAGHSFEGWFASAEACDEQAAAGRLACPTCASADVRKLPSAPYVKASSCALRAPAREDQARAKALAALRRHVLANTEDVGRRFAEVARRMHYGEEPGRGIRGRASLEEAAGLAEEGIAALALSPEVLPPDDLH